MTIDKPFFTRDRNAAAIAAGHMEVGPSTYGAIKVHHWRGRENGRLIVGDYCSIAHGVEVFLGGNHRPDWVALYPFNTLSRRWPKAARITGQPTTRGDVVIGNDVWIGAGAVIMSGVTIGDGAVIGARAVVGRSIPPFAIAVGNPAAVVRHRFDDATVAALLRIRWWDWPVERVAEVADQLASADLVGFIARHDPGEGG